MCYYVVQMGSKNAKGKTPLDFLDALKLTSKGAVKVSISLPADLLAFADAVAEQTGATRSDVVQQALREQMTAMEVAYTA